MMRCVSPSPHRIRTSMWSSWYHLAGKNGLSLPFMRSSTKFFHLKVAWSNIYFNTALEVKVSTVPSSRCASSSPPLSFWSSIKCWNDVGTSCYFFKVEEPWATNALFIRKNYHLLWWSFCVGKKSLVISLYVYFLLIFHSSPLLT